MDAGSCSPPPESYTCTFGDPSTCVGGICITNGWCVGQVVDAGWYDGCGNGVCDPCETAQSCPGRLCPGAGPDRHQGLRRPQDDHRLGPRLLEPHAGRAGDHDLRRPHGLQRSRRGAADLRAEHPVRLQQPGRRHGAESGHRHGVLREAAGHDVDDAPGHRGGGAVPDLGGPTGLQRYGLILGKFIKWRLAYTGANYANLVCHSMGCLISRYVIENDIEGLASSQKIVRWETNAGVVAGARLARLYDNPNVQSAANAIGLATDDFAVMNPLYVQQYAAPYDHQLYAANNPLYNGILIHNVGATDQSLPQALGISLLDTIPGENAATARRRDHVHLRRVLPHDRPARDRADAQQRRDADQPLLRLGGSHRPAQGRGVAHADGRGALPPPQGHRHAAVHRAQQRLRDGLDHAFHGRPAARRDRPRDDRRLQRLYKPTFGTTATLHVDTLGYRSADMSQQSQGATLMPGQVLFEAPVFDGQTTFHLNVKLTETDYYPRFSVLENMLAATGLLTSNQNILTYDGEVSLTNQMIPATSASATVQFQVQVVDMY